MNAEQPRPSKSPLKGRLEYRKAKIRTCHGELVECMTDGGLSVCYSLAPEMSPFDGLRVTRCVSDVALRQVQGDKVGIIGFIFCIINIYC